MRVVEAALTNPGTGAIAPQLVLVVEAIKHTKRASTVYEVPGRGRFYTDADGKVVRGETTSGGGAAVHPDLNRPLPGVEYVVNGDTVFGTDNLARTVEMDARGLTTGEGTRSDSIQGGVGAEGRAEFTDPVTGEPLIDPATGEPYDYVQDPQHPCVDPVRDRPH